MTWHCRDWAQNLVGEWADTFEDGDDYDIVYNDARCSSFNRDASAVVGIDDEVDDWQLSDGGDAFCNTHDRAATWETNFSVPQDLERAGLYVCRDCATVYHDEMGWMTHRNDEHGEDHDLADETIFVRAQPHPPNGFRPRPPSPPPVWNGVLGQWRPPVATSHRSWA